MIPIRNTRSPRGSEKGVALVVSLLALMLITAIAVGLLVASNTESNVSSNFRDEQAAFFGAKAGIEEVRDRFRSNAPDGLLASLPSNLTGSSNAVLYITNPNGSETVAPWDTAGSNYPDDEICNEQGVTCTAGVPNGSPWYRTVSASSSYAASPVLPWKWVRVIAKTNRMSSGSSSVNAVDGNSTSNNRVCWTGTNQTTVAAASCPSASASYMQVYEITALAVTPSGSRRMVQVEASSSTFPTLPGPMILDGSNPTFSDPNSNHTHANGMDASQGPNGGAGCPAAANEPSIGTMDSAGATAIDGTINPAHYPGIPAGAAAVNGALSANSSMNLTTVDGLTKLVNLITVAAGANVYNATAPTNMGTNANPAINVVNGDVAVGGSGAGILLVTGVLTENGGFNYNGLILVIGKGQVIKHGGGGGVMNGSIFVANMYTDTTYTTPIALGASPPNPPGPPIFNWNGGGNALLQYDSCWVNSVSNMLPYRIVAVREMMF